MSDMTDPVQARGWVQAWREHYAKQYSGPVGLARRLRKTATEQRANHDGNRRFGGSKGRAAYTESVEMLEREAEKAEAAAERWRAAEAKKAAEAEKLAAERRAELMRKYPKVR